VVCQKVASGVSEGGEWCVRRWRVVCPTHICVYTYMCICVYRYTYMCICVYTYMCMCVCEISVYRDLAIQR